MSDECAVPGLLTVNDAIQKIVEAALQQENARQVEVISLQGAFNRILAQDIVSQLDVPPCDNSAMDGYAFKAADLQTNNTLSCVGIAYAGKPFKPSLENGQCVRIMTGAPIPSGADTVIMQEQTKANDDYKVVFLTQKPLGNNVRKAGENIAKGSTVLTKGSRLDAAKIALLASLGESEVRVFEKLKVGVLATGDELVDPGVELEYGQIYESNRLALKILLEQFGAEVIDYGIVADEQALIYDVINKANRECDLVLSSGGVSVGEADYVKAVLEQLGSVGFWKVAIKPGKPFAFGRLSGSWFCGLPGNPVSSYVTCQQLVFPLLKTLQHEFVKTPDSFMAIAETDIKKQVGRKDYQRGIYRLNENGTVTAKPNGPQGSGIMSSIANANCYIVIDAEQGSISKGESVRIIPFDSLYT